MCIEYSVYRIPCATCFKEIWLNLRCPAGLLLSCCTSHLSSFIRFTVTDVTSSVPLDLMIPLVFCVTLLPYVSSTVLSFLKQFVGCTGHWMVLMFGNRDRLSIFNSYGYAFLIPWAWTKANNHELHCRSSTWRTLQNFMSWTFISFNTSYIHTIIYCCFIKPMQLN